MLRLDLADGISHRDAEGRVADFHGLHITLLVRSGAIPKEAQKQARRSDIRLTMNFYTHARHCDLAGAVENFPSLLPTGPKALRAWDTDGAGVRESLRKRPGRERETESW
jgi:hypothetical protein